MLSRRAALLLALSVAAILGAYVLYPALETFWLVLSGEGLRVFFAGWQTTGTRALFNSVWVSLVTVAGAGALGTALAWSLWRYAFPAREALRLLAALALVALPIATIVLLSFADTGAWTTELLPRRLTLEHYARLLTDARFYAPIANSLIMALLATVANLVFGIGAGMVLAGSRLPGRGLLGLLAMLPFAIPGTVIALNLNTGR